MELVMDFLLLAASGTACLYCFILSRRLKGLTSANGGLGAGVAALSKSAEDMRTAIEATKKSADKTAARLEGLLAKADEKEARVDELMDQLADMSASVVNHADGATKKYVDGLAPFIGEANSAAQSLVESLERASRHSRTRAKQAIARAKKRAAVKKSHSSESDLEFVLANDAKHNALGSDAPMNRAQDNTEIAA